MQVHSTQASTAFNPAAMLSPLKCGRCRGTGQFVGHTGKVLGECFTCKGSGKAIASAPVRQAAAAPTAAPTVSDEALRDAFDRARASGLKRIRLTLGTIVVKPAKATGANPGALYVTDADSDTYLGKVMGGRFMRAGCCSAEQATKVAELISDPKSAIETHGKVTGQCAMCGLTLTDPDSVALGIGPICAERWGF